MICFPLNNTEYEASALGAWCATRTRGVFAADGHYAVTTNGNMSVTVSPGLAWLKADTYWGVNMFEVNPTVLTLETADGSLPRVDAICVQLDKNLNTGSLVVKRGAYSPQPPVAPPPLRNLDYDEICIATVTVRRGATSILTSDITDQRLNEAACGIMRDGVTGIPTQTLHNQWIAWFEEFEGDAQALFANYRQLVLDLYTQYQAEIATNAQNAQAAYDAFIDRMFGFETTAQADFEAWVQTLKDKLDEETAGHLQLQIDDLRARTPSATLGTVSAAATGRLYPQCALLATSWAYGIGGAGQGPAGGTSVNAVEAGFSYDERDITVSAPEQYRAHTAINQLSESMYAFMADAGQTQSLVFQIYE